MIILQKGTKLFHGYATLKEKPSYQLTMSQFGKDVYNKSSSYCLNLFRSGFRGLTMVLTLDGKSAIGAHVSVI